MSQFAPTPQSVGAYVKNVLTYMTPEQFNEFLNKIPEKIAALKGAPQLERKVLIQLLKENYLKF